MSQPISFQKTKFINLPDGEQSLGFRAYDEYGKTYCNYLTTLPDDDLEFLQVVKENTDDTIIEMFRVMKENEEGCEINGTYYDWDEVKEIILG